MGYKLQTDDQILQDLADKVDHHRRLKRITDKELVTKGGTSERVLNNFRQGHGGITLKSFIRVLRGLGELDALEAFLAIKEPYSPTGRHLDIPKKRVRESKANESEFTWGDDK